MTELSRPFRSTIVHADGDATVELGGEIDLACVPQLRQQLDEAIDSSGGDVNIELSDVSFLDSTALTLLVAAHHRLTTSQRRLTVLNPSRTACRVFEFSGLIEVFDVRPPAAETTDR